MAKKILKRITGIISMIVALAMFVLFMQDNFCMRPDFHQVRLEGYYMEDKNSLDVVVMGSSEVYNGYSAAEMYRTTGVTSYPFTFPNNPVTLWKYELKEIERTQNPKVLVIEPNGALYNEDYLYKEHLIRILGDVMPFSKNKIDFVNDCAKYGPDSKITYYLPFLKYHGEWGHGQSLAIPKMRMRGHAALRGAFAQFKVSPQFKCRDVTGDTNTAPLNPEAEKYLREFLDEAKESGVERIVFLRFPHRVVSEERYNAFKRGNEIRRIITEEYGFEYIDLFSAADDIGLVNEDWVDGEHLNARGQKKMSDYLGKLLCDKYELKPSELTDKQKAEWDESALCITYFYKRFDKYMLEHKDEFIASTKKGEIDQPRPGKPHKDGLRFIQVEDEETMRDIEKMIQEDKAKEGASEGD